MERIEKDVYELTACMDESFEEDVLNTFEQSLETETGDYICDLIMRVADDHVPISYSELWENAEDIEEYIDEALAQGVASDKGNIVSILQAGYYQYLSELLYSNLDTLVFNAVAEKFNQYLGTLDESEVEQILVQDVEEQIRVEVEQYDNNNMVSNIEEIANQFIQAVENGEYAF